MAKCQGLRTLIMVVGGPWPCNSSSVLRALLSALPRTLDTVHFRLTTRDAVDRFSNKVPCWRTVDNALHAHEMLRAVSMDAVKEEGKGRGGERMLRALRSGERALARLSLPKLNTAGKLIFT